jgi:Fe-S-cluster containining protein
VKQTRWYKDGLKFTCTGCGSCCTGAPGYVWLEEGEAERIAAFLGMETGAFLEEHGRFISGRYSLKEYKNGDCEFLDPEEGKCRVYSVRPVQCSTFPFWGAVVHSRDTWESRARQCPGMNNGTLHSADDIDRILEQDA